MKPGSQSEIEGPTDAHLCTLAEAGGTVGERAFAELWRRHHQYIVHFCALRLPSRSDAEDVAQNVFVKAHAALASFRGRSRLRTWLTAIAIHECADHRRREARHDSSARWVAPPPEQGLEGLGEGVLAPRAQDATGVLDVVLQLPLHVREVLYMRFFRELGFEEIARELGLGLSAAKMRVYRAVEQTRVAFEVNQ